MKKMLGLLVGLLFGTTGLVCAATIDYSYVDDSNGDPTTPYSWATVETFDNESLLWNWAPEGDYTIRSGDVINGESAPPAGDETNYVSVPQTYDDNNYAEVTVTNLGGDHNYFGLFWGSVDSYNKLEFYDEGTLIASFTGDQAIYPSDANGNQTAPSTNLYVNFYFGDETFDSFKMISSQMAFEADNIAVGTVPVPSAFFLLASGILGLAGVRRKKTA